MAQQLHAAGQEVALLGLFDTYNFTRIHRSTPLSFLWQKSGFHAGNLRRLPWKDWPGYFSFKMRVARDGELSSIWKLLGGRANRNESLSTEVTLQEYNNRANECYLPKPYAGQLTVFKPKKNYDFMPDPQMGWGDIVEGGLEIVELPVNPHAMLAEPFVKLLAGELRYRLSHITGLPRDSKSRQPAPVQI
jgi:thioesterase domain-containing protein